MGTPSADGQPAGFELTAARVTAADGEVCELCLWLADSPDRRRQGLIGVTDLGRADGMVFRYDEPSPSAFHMRGAPLPLVYRRVVVTAPREDSSRRRSSSRA